MTTKGFYSAVEDRDDPNFLLVRCRAKKDIEATGWPYKESDGDYRYRARVPKTNFAVFISRAINVIDYPNFKDAVGELDPDRADVYLDVWWLLRQRRVSDD